MDEKRLTELVRSSGCNAKLPPGDLHEVLDSLPHDADARLIGGYEKSDDAFVYDIGVIPSRSGRSRRPTPYRIYTPWGRSLR